MRLCLLLLTALRMIPLIFNEAKQILFFLRFRGIRFTSLSITQKIKASKQLMYALLMRGMDTVFYSGYILEVRGFGVDKADRLSNRNPIHAADIALIGVILTLNAVGLFIRLDFPV